MEPNKILSANLLDLIFDDRNKEYGAYDLRATYPARIRKSLVVTASIGVLIFGGAVLGNSLKPDKPAAFLVDSMTIRELPPEEEIKEPEIEKKKPVEEPIQREQYTSRIVLAEEVDQPPPDHHDLEDAIIDVHAETGIDDPRLVAIDDLDEDKKIIVQKPEETTIMDIVQIPARYDGNWERFLTNNLRADIPVNNGAPTGSYKVLIQFVVDKDGTVSDIKALTGHGYGMEEEAIRVLKKAKGWKAGINAGIEVKSYHRQPITFVVQSDE